jgi:branched-chain amino acid transport system ATP-binding protein
VILSLDSVTKTFGGLTAVDRVSLDVGEGEIYSIIGPNGAGKTTLFNVLSGLCRADSGRVWFAGHDLRGLSPDRVAGLGIGRTFQSIRLFGAMTVFENVLVGLHTRLGYSYPAAVLRTRRFAEREREARAAAHEVLAYVGLHGHASELARNLPYGRQRRLEIARALAMRPSLLLLDEPAAGMNPQETAVLLLDEPTMGLAPVLVDSIFDTVVELNRMGKAILLVEQNAWQALRIAHRGYVLQTGQIALEGRASDLAGNPSVRESYLGAWRALPPQTDCCAVAQRCGKMPRMKTEEFRALARIMKALASPVRLRIVDELSRGERCVGELQPLFPMNKSTLSRHVAALRNVGIVSERREGVRCFLKLQTPCILNVFECALGVIRSEARRQAKLAQG